MKNNMLKLNILVTGCFAPGTSGTLYGISHSERLEVSNILGIDQTLRMKSRPGFTKLLEVDSTSPREYIQSIVETVRQWDIQVILPQTTRETLILAEYASLIPKETKLVIAGDFLAITKANNKFTATLAASECGVGVTPIMDGRDIPNLINFLTNEISLHGSCFLKKKNGSGGRGVIRVIDDKQISSHIATKPTGVHLLPLSICLEILTSRKIDPSEYYAMPEIHGVEYTVDIFRNSSQFIAVPRKRIIMRSGVSSLNQLINHPELIEQCKRLSEKLQLTGIFGFQFLENQQGELFFLECNPRIQGTMHATILGGTNLIEYAVLDSMGSNVKIKEPDWTTRFCRTEDGYIEYT